MADVQQYLRRNLSASLSRLDQLAAAHVDSAAVKNEDEPHLERNDLRDQFSAILGFVDPLECTAARILCIFTLLGWNQHRRNVSAFASKVKPKAVESFSNLVNSILAKSENLAEKDLEELNFWCETLSSALEYSIAVSKALTTNHRKRALADSSDNEYDRVRSASAHRESRAPSPPPILIKSEESSESSTTKSGGKFRNLPIERASTSTPSQTGSSTATSSPPPSYRSTTEQSSGSRSLRRRESVNYAPPKKKSKIYSKVHSAPIPFSCKPGDVVLAPWENWGSWPSVVLDHTKYRSAWWRPLIEGKEKSGHVLVKSIPHGADWQFISTKLLRKLTEKSPMTSGLHYEAHKSDWRLGKEIGLDPLRLKTFLSRQTPAEKAERAKMKRLQLL